MKKYNFILLTALLSSLFIYLFYRTEKTVVNEIFIWIVSYDHFVAMQDYISNKLPLHERVIYSMPEGLWVYCITLTSKFVYVKIANREINLYFVPLVFSIGLELFQLLHLTNGRFDFWDIGFSIVFWAIAHYFMKHNGSRENLFSPFALHSSVCLSSYMIVYLAHVWQ